MPHTASSRSQIAIIIVNYRTPTDTTECIESLLRLATADDVSYSIIVVDNASGDGSWCKLTEWAAAHCSALNRDQTLPVKVSNQCRFVYRSEAKSLPMVLLETAQNHGYAAGVNIGIQYALADHSVTHLWVLNADTVVLPDAMMPLLAKSIATPLAIIGSTLLYADDPTLVQAAGGAVYWPTVGRSRHCGKRKRLNQLGERSFSFDYVVGASMFLSRSVMYLLGYLPEGFFLYFEETAWCRLAQKRGVALLWVPESQIIHKEGRSTGATDRFTKLSDTSFYYVIRNSFAYTLRYYPVYLPSVFLFNFLQTTKYVVAGDGGKWKLFVRGLKECVGVDVGVPRIVP